MERAGKGRLKAAWTLVLLAPLCAEAAFTGISLPAIWLAFPLLIPIYGAGVLLARELVCRAGAGLLGLLVIGFGYEIAEDGLGLQALTSPHLYTAASWGRVLGVNVTYWESQLGYHLIFTLLIPVALTTMLFARHGRKPYLGTFGLIGTAVVFVVGIGITRLAISSTQDPGYQTPWPVVAAELVGIIVLGVLALVVVPRLSAVRPSVVARLPQPVVMSVVAGIAPIVFLGLLFPVKSSAGHPAIGHGAWVAIPMVVALAIAVGVGWLVARWSATEGFTDRHRIWLIGGALVGHSLVAVVSGVVNGHVLLSPVVGVVVLVVTVLGCYAIGNRRATSASQVRLGSVR
ncbi:MAG TPA: hypothetical protein VGN81_20010 [Pseudonocardiaceae bacterium]|jgi:hypothetical protein